MGNIFSYLKVVPEYLNHVWQTMPVVFVLVVIVFAVSLFSGRIPAIIRKLFIVACIVYALIGGLTKRTEYGRQMVWVAAICLILLAVVRSIVYFIQTTRQNKINARIEEKALEKAARRRGSFRNKQGYSGESRPLEYEEEDNEMDSEEIEALVRGEEPEVAVKLSSEKKKPAQKPSPEAPAAADASFETANAPAPAAAPAPVSSRPEAPVLKKTGSEIPAYKDAVTDSPAYRNAGAEISAGPSEALSEADLTDFPPVTGALDEMDEDLLPEHLTADELYTMMNRISDLHSLGILTDEEYSNKKAELLQRL